MYVSCQHLQTGGHSLDCWVLVTVRSRVEGASVGLMCSTGAYTRPQGHMDVADRQRIAVHLERLDRCTYA